MKISVDLDQLAFEKPADQDLHCFTQDRSQFSMVGELIENLVFSAVTFYLFFPVDSILDHIPRPQMLLVIIIQLSMTILFCICFL